MSEEGYSSPGHQRGADSASTWLQCGRESGAAGNGTGARNPTISSAPASTDSMELSGTSAGSPVLSATPLGTCAGQMRISTRETGISVTLLKMSFLVWGSERLTLGPVP